MKTINELMYYCKQDNPVGALLLTGEWGSGKTYIIDNTLKKELCESHVIVRISLFGVSSIDEFHQIIKSNWIDETDSLRTKVKKYKGLFDILGKFRDAIPDDTIKGFAGGLFSIDLTSFFKIKNEVNGKKVVLVFDDLERSKLSTIELLGAINEYCENRHFNVIIIADEEKLKCQSSGNELSFHDIKEKVVCRTVYVDQNYRSVIKNIIDNVSDEKYKTFLLTRIEDIVALISGKRYQVILWI